MILPCGERSEATRDLEAPIAHYQLPPTSGALVLGPLTVTLLALFTSIVFCLAAATALA
jgi:hypothetical protein